VLGFRYERERIDEDASNAVVAGVGHFQQQQTGLRRDRHSDLVTQFESAASLERHFFEEELHDAIEAILVGGRKPRDEWNLITEEAAASVWESGRSAIGPELEGRRVCAAVR